MRKGMAAAIISYMLWGILPVFWKQIQMVPALETLAHRTVWAFVFVAVLLVARKQRSWLQLAAENPKALTIFIASACLLALNWFTYIWAVNAGHIVDSSMGYFITPLVSVLLGVLFLRERLRVGQAVAIGLAAAGVIFLTLGLGAFPWIALVLAGTWGFYSLLRKIAPLGSLEGLALETAMLSLPALAYLVYLEVAGTASFGHAGTRISILLVLTGVVTALPLLTFTYAARRVTLATVGILQYIAPTMQFLLGVFLYREPFTQAHLVGFGAIWLALLVYSVEGALDERRRRAISLSVG